MTRIIFTDLDGTLLDRKSYSWNAAAPALKWLNEHEVPWLLVSSKTRAEVEYWGQVLGNRHPFSVENGSAICVPRNYFDELIPGSIQRGGYDTIERGSSYAAAVRALSVAAQASGCRVRGFHEMTAEEVAAASQLPLDLAVLAKKREYDEPFEALDPERVAELEAAIRTQGLRCIRGGRFHHICGDHDKADSVRQLSNLFGRTCNEVVTVGLGDGFNDVPLLRAVDVPVIVRSRDAAAMLRSVPNAFVTDHEGPRGWNAAILDIFRNHDSAVAAV